MLTELGFVTEDEKKMHGDLPEEIIEAVRAKELKRDYLTASLRTYQSFGARFALVQEKVVIGDEMGLGKTVEALAVFTHLRATGHSHFLVVCPAAVVSNWVREVAEAHELRRTGSTVRSGNATTRPSPGFATVALRSRRTTSCRGPKSTRTRSTLAAAVFDEAHYIKNPLAKRSIAAAAVMDSTQVRGPDDRHAAGEQRPRVPQPHRLHPLRPLRSAPEYLASRFRKHVAPAYLRRNQEDVLTELPELVEVDEWMGMSDTDEVAYRAAVPGRQLHADAPGSDALREGSLKVQRLLEIVARRKPTVAGSSSSPTSAMCSTRSRACLPGQGLRAADRLCRRPRPSGTWSIEFSQAGHGAALVAQITAGGVGLNIQSASVVVICEPQLKPTMEAQAIARAHRMGQTNTVQVHRLLTENSVDERIREILAEKSSSSTSSRATA